MIKIITTNKNNKEQLIVKYFVYYVVLNERHEILTNELSENDTNEIISTNNNKCITIIHYATDVDFHGELNESVNINVYHIY